MRMYDIIAKKRDGAELTFEEIKHFVTGYCDGRIPDYQAAALLMAIFIRGMDKRETAELTAIMADSGGKADLSGIPGIKVDKHSTGGVGDKTTLVVAPVVAACGVPVAKMSGRGLGHTGGTIDKLESIPGFRTALPIEEFLENVRVIGVSIIGQTGNLVPADKKLYALRDVTATVNNISLIASSIMSKKIAAGADRIVLDVKTGSGAFMKTLEDSISLAEAMVDIGEKTGRRTAAFVTDMDIPLGYAVGNSLEVIEAVETLKGKGPKDLEEVSLELAAKMLQMAGAGSFEICRNLAGQALRNGKALEKLAAMIARQGGDPGVVENYNLFGKAEFTCDFTAETDGYVEAIRTDLLGTASMVLGAGRETKESALDYTAGITLIKKTGMKLDKGDVIATLHTNKREKIPEALRIMRQAYVLKPERPPLRPLILAGVDSEGVRVF